MALQEDMAEACRIITNELAETMQENHFVVKANHVFTKWGMVYMFTADFEGKEPCVPDIAEALNTILEGVPRS